MIDYYSIEGRNVNAGGAITGDLTTVPRALGDQQSYFLEQSLAAPGFTIGRVHSSGPVKIYTDGFAGFYGSASNANVTFTFTFNGHLVQYP